ncbi:MAG TPA: hypothetical protein VFQ25_04680 [Ktedonobacterales bacterium]|nr:hypothetical protein [Ktedonobacterales bacterium]
MAFYRSHPEIPASLLTMIRSLKLVLLPGVGHLSNVDAPNQLNAAVCDFLRSLSQRPGQQPGAG